MRKELPAGVVETLSVPGFRPEKGDEALRELGITSLAGLEESLGLTVDDLPRGWRPASPALAAAL